MNKGDHFLMKYKNKKGESKKAVLLLMRRILPLKCYRFAVLPDCKYLDIPDAEVKKLSAFENKIHLSDKEKSQLKKNDILYPSAKTEFFNFERIGMTMQEYQYMTRQGLKVKERKGFRTTLKTNQRDFTVSDYKLQRLFTLKRLE